MCLGEFKSAVLDDSYKTSAGFFAPFSLYFLFFFPKGSTDPQELDYTLNCHMLLRKA